MRDVGRDVSILNHGFNRTLNQLTLFSKCSTLIELARELLWSSRIMRLTSCSHVPRTWAIIDIVYLYVCSALTVNKLLLQKSVVSIRGSCTRGSPAMYPAMPDSSRQASSAMPNRHHQPSQTGIVRSARIEKTSRSCTVTGGTPKFFFAALMAALCFWSGRNTWSPVLCRRTSFGFGGAYLSD